MELDCSLQHCIESGMSFDSRGVTLGSAKQPLNDNQNLYQ
jgi:hypothetical protein